MATTETQTIGKGDVGTIPSADTPPDPPEPKKPKAEKTRYVVLVSLDGGETWREVGKHQASSRKSAVAHQYPNPEDLPKIGQASKQALFQAVPERSWVALKAAPSPPQPPVVVSEA